MKKVELSEAKAMLKEILAAKSASHDSIGTVLKLGTYDIDTQGLRGYGELGAPLKAIARATLSMKDGTILLEDSMWQKLEAVYYNRVTKHVLF